MTTTSILLSTNESWKKLDFVQLQKDLESTAADLATRQDESDNSRRKLIELSREFKKNTPEDVRKTVAPLLKSFQGEVDVLSKRSKLAEGDYLTLYKKLIDMPDPCAALDYGVTVQKKLQRCQDVEMENKQLRERLEEYNAEFADVKNQEVTIRQLREKMHDLESQMEASVSTHVREKERELTTRFAEKEREIVEKQMVAVRKLGEVEQKAANLQNNLEHCQSELFDLRIKHEETCNARSAESEMLLAEMERTNEKCASLERECEAMRNDLHSVSNSANKEVERSIRASDKVVKQQQLEDRKCQMELELEVTAKEKEITQLVDELRRTQMQLSQSRDLANAQLARMEDDLTSRRSRIEQLESQLARQADYDEVRRELDVLRSIEFANLTGTSSGEEVEEGSEEDTASQFQGKTLEQLLLEKNRAMQNELTQIKVGNLQLTSKIEALETEKKDSACTITEQRALIGQLEEDLRQVKAFSAMFRGSAEGQDCPSGSPKSTALSTGPNEAQLLADVVGDMGASPELNEYKSGTSASDSLLPIVQSQRDRFRQRNLELEAQASSHQMQLQTLQGEMDKMRMDNVKLYEKIKFLHSYSGKSSADDVTMHKYSGAYEEGLNPFTNFSKKEKQRKYQDLKPYDKITLSMGRLIMGNSTARMVAFFYTLFMHLLVFIVLYRMAHTEAKARDTAADCNRDFQNHMIKFHKPGEHIHQ